MSRPPSKVEAFLDTNIFVQFRAFEEIDWPGLLEADEVQLMLTSIVLRELDEAKNGNDRRLRPIAARVLSTIRDWKRGTPPPSLRRGVALGFFRDAPVEVLAAHHFVPAWNDHRLIAAVLAAPRSDRVRRVLVTDDTSAGMSADELGIEVFALPDALRRDPEKDPLEKELQDAKRKLHELTFRLPVVVVGFVGSNDRHQAFTLSAPSPRLSPGTVHQRVSDLQDALEKVGVGGDELATYLRKMQDYWEEAVSHSELLSRHLLLQLRVANEGRAVADNLDVTLELPAGFEVRPEIELKAPLEPRRPTRRRGRFAIPAPLVVPEPRDVEALGYGRRPRIHANAAGTTVSYELGDLKHHNDRALYPVSVLFADHEDAGSFELKFSASTSALPELVEGVLRVVVHKE